MKIEQIFVDADAELFRVYREAFGIPAQWVSSYLGKKTRTVYRWEDSSLPFNETAKKVLLGIFQKIHSEIYSYAEMLKSYLDQIETPVSNIVLPWYDVDNYLWESKPEFWGKYKFPLSVQSSFLCKVIQELPDYKFTVNITRFNVVAYNRWYRDSGRDDSPLLRFIWLNEIKKS